MRVWHLGVVGVGGLMLLSLTGCAVGTTGPTGPSSSTGPPASAGDGSKLKKDILGKWQGKSGDTTVDYDFKDDGKYEFEAGKTKFTGEWKAVDDSHIEEKFKLTKEDAEVLKGLKPVAKATRQLSNPLNPTLAFSKTAPAKVPEPLKEGDNTRIIQAVVAGDVLTLGEDKLKKQK